MSKCFFGVCWTGGGDACRAVSPSLKGALQDPGDFQTKNHQLWLSPHFFAYLKSGGFASESWIISSSGGSGVASKLVASAFWIFLRYPQILWFLKLPQGRIYQKATNDESMISISTFHQKDRFGHTTGGSPKHPINCQPGKVHGCIMVHD